MPPTTFAAYATRCADTERRAAAGFTRLAQASREATEAARGLQAVVHRGRKLIQASIFLGHLGEAIQARMEDVL